MDSLGVTNKDITICLTSCSRFDLLERTIKSLVQHWDGPKPDGKNVSMILNEDGIFSEDSRKHFTEIINIIDGWLGGNFRVIGTKGPPVGQIKAIDRIYSEVTTPYIFHCEDDWEFTKPGFIHPSIDILENNPNICQVWIRKPNDRNGHPATGRILQTENRTKYQLLKTGYRGVWNGFSLNPGLRRLSDYKKIGPYSAYMKRNSLDTEAEIGKAYLRFGYRAATLLTGYVEHIGHKRGLPK